MARVIDFSDGFESNASPIPISLSGFNVEYVTITALMIFNKSLTLASAPTTSGQTVLMHTSGPAQKYGVDFTVSGTTLTWNGLGLDGVIAENDVVIVQYD